MNKQNAMLLLAGVAVGYLLASTFTGINDGKNPFASISAQGATLATK